MSHSTEHTGGYIPETYIPHVESHGTKGIWRVFWVLLVLTLIDIAFYFIMDPGMTRNIIFIILGIVKAYFIVGDFMHMKHERKVLKASIIGPVIFIVALIMGLMQEGYMLDVLINK